MSLIKLATEQQRQDGIVGWTKRHPLLASGIALTGGIAAADAGVSAFNALRQEGKQTLGAGLKQFKDNPAFRQAVGKQALHGLGQGALYGGILSAVEPAILHGGLRKKVE